MKSVLRAQWVVLAVSGLATVGCGSEDPMASADEQDVTEQTIAFESLDLWRSSSPAGAAVLKSEAAFESFFGAAQPASVDFNKHWVVHYSLGMRRSGGYGATIERIGKIGGAEKTLVVYGHESAPGPDCVVTMAITNPQITVRINKQPSTPATELVEESETVSCSAARCEDLGGECKPVPADYPRSVCESLHRMVSEPKGECSELYRTCCVPHRCGGIAGLVCPEGLELSCVDDATDSCDPDDGGFDCSGVCVPQQTGP